VGISKMDWKVVRKSILQRMHRNVRNHCNNKRVKAEGSFTKGELKPKEDDIKGEEVR